MANELSLLPSNDEWDKIKQIAEQAVRSKLLPDAIQTPEQAAIIILKGRELGLPPMVSFAHINVIRGKPSMSGEIMLAYIRKEFPKAEINFEESTDKVCKITCRRSPSEKLMTIEMTYQQAYDAGFAKQWDKEKRQWVVKDNWQKQPKTMLRWRCISEMKRFVFPEILMGIDYTPDELEDIPEKTEKTSARESIVVDSKPTTVVNAEQSQEGEIVDADFKVVDEQPAENLFAEPFCTQAEADILKAKCKELNWSVKDAMRYIDLKFKCIRLGELRLSQFQEVIKTIETFIPVDAFAELQKS